FFQAEDGIRYDLVTGVQTCALPILMLRKGLPRSCAGAPSTPAACQTKRGKQMRAAVFVGTDQPLVIENVNPTAPGPQDVVVEIEIGRASCRERGESAVGGGIVR